MNDRRRATRLRTATLLLPVALCAASSEAVDNHWVGPNLGNWNVDANWSIGFVPDATFNEAAAINNHTSVVVSSLVPTEVAGLKLGQAAGQGGGLRIQTGGILRNVAAVSETGAVAIGSAGEGSLTILGGGMLMGTSLSLGGTPGSSITLGDASALTARLLISPGAASLQRTTTVVGPNVDFSAAGGFTLASSSTLIADIRHNAVHSPLKSAGAATLGGTFRPVFTGVTPVLGNAWNIIDTASITGSFALDTSAAPALPPGQAYQLIQSDGGANGKLLQLTVAPQVVTAHWNINSDGDWSLGGNWTGGIAPNGGGHTATFGSIIAAPRTVTVDLARTIGAINFDNSASYTIAGPGAITMDAISGAAAIAVVLGNHTIDAPLTLVDDTTVDVSAAASTLAVTGVLTATGRAITKTGAGTARFSNIRAGGLTISAGRVQAAPNGGPAGTSRVDSLSITSGARLDLSDNDLVIDYTGSSPISTVRTLIRTAYNTGDWTGEGIMTSMGNASQLGLGYAQSTAIFTTFPASFSAQQVDNTALLIAFTRFGDADLNGVVNLGDFNRLAANFGLGGRVWSEGDFNYDEVVNLADFNLLAGNFGLSAGPGGPTPADWAALAAAVPEPAGALVGLLTSMAFAAISPRRPRI